MTRIRRISMWGGALLLAAHAPGAWAASQPWDQDPAAAVTAEADEILEASPVDQYAPLATD
ncbi:hypothetical protein JW933_00475, partial [candidate division FCPU426 bacterium]|nr:hypothetical protein [candidate division FCPU426 bacterium]